MVHELAQEHQGRRKAGIFRKPVSNGDRARSLSREPGEERFDSLGGEREVRAARQSGASPRTFNARAISTFGWPIASSTRSMARSMSAAVNGE
jgi:hypothetical protein